jgi:hypothetical protein
MQESDHQAGQAATKTEAPQKMAVPSAPGTFLPSANELLALRAGCPSSIPLPLLPGHTDLQSTHRVLQKVPKQLSLLALANSIFTSQSPCFKDMLPDI